jgi:hypothetical protein
MKFDTLDVYQNAWFQAYWIKINTLYHYKNMFKSGGLHKSISNIVAMVASIIKTMEKNLDKAPHLTRLTCQY